MSKGTKLTRGDRSVVAFKPSTVTRLKSQGWKTSDQESEPAVQAPKKTVERPAGTKDTNDK
jgi:hypothetical protein